MMRWKLLSLASIAAAASLAACGDNDNKTCGAGTTDVNGVCTGSDIQCTDGTILVDDHCAIDPNSCQDGTVLMGDKCVDPSTQTATIEEAIEPNGLGLGGEASNGPAGEIDLKPVGEHFTIHGKIKPFQDADGDGQNDADFDSYVIDVTAPTMISVSADGLHGLAGGFVAVANVGANDPLANWQRFGVNPTGDTAKRQLYLPLAGTYVIAIADSRSLFLTGSAPGAGMDQPDMEYYVTVDQLTATPTALTVTSGVATSQGQLTPGEVKLFSVAMGGGYNEAELGVTIDQVQESLVLANTRSSVTAIKAVSDGDPGDGATAYTAALNLLPTDTQVVAVDSVFDYANAAYDYDLTIHVRTAGALSTNGMDVSQPADPDGSFSTFYYDVSQDLKTVGMDLAFDRPVAGVIVDEDLFIFSLFTYDPDFGFGIGDTFTDYKGLLRHATPGRYFFMVFDPEMDTTDITATSTYAGLQEVAVTKGTALANQALNAYASNPFSYSATVATAPWQLFNATGTGTGNISGRFYNPTSAIGRIDPLPSSTCGSYCEDAPLPVFSQTWAAAGAPQGRILLDDGTTDYFVAVKTATVTGTPTFNLEFADRVYTNLGTAMPGTAIPKIDQPLDATVTVQRYLVKTAAGNGLTTTVTPEQLLMNTRIQALSKTETSVGAAINNGIAGQPDTWLTLQGTSGWTAFTVTSSAAAIVGGQFDLNVLATAPVTYTRTAGATAYSDACTGGTTVAMSDDDDGQSTATINAPTGFDFFGFAAPQLRVFSNGFISFDTALTCSAAGAGCAYTNANIPAAANPNAVVAPFWDDLVVTGICQKTVGTKLIIQWTGDRLEQVNFTPAGPVAFQAIFDGSNDTVEFVYDAAHAANGVANGDTATIGIENQAGTAASKVGFNQANTATGVLFTPM